MQTALQRPLVDSSFTSWFHLIYINSQQSDCWNLVLIFLRYIGYFLHDSHANLLYHRGFRRHLSQFKAKGTVSPHQNLAHLSNLGKKSLRFLCMPRWLIFIPQGKWSKSKIWLTNNLITQNFLLLFVPNTYLLEPLLTFRKLIMCLHVLIMDTYFRHKIHEKKKWYLVILCRHSAVD